MIIKGTFSTILHKNICCEYSLEILRISLIETKTESNPNRVKNPREISIFLWKSLEMFVMVTGKVSGIRLPRFLIIAFSSAYCTWHNFSFLWFIQTKWIILIVKRYWCLPWILHPIRFWFQLGLSVRSLIESNRCDSNEYPHHIFLWRNMEKYP